MYQYVICYIFILIQVILKNEFPFEIKLSEINNAEVESLAKVIESTGGNEIVNGKNSDIK